jgi:multidrug efflux pump subunit AcrB
MSLISLALRRPISVLIIIAALAISFFAAIGKPLVEQFGGNYPTSLPKGMEVDVFPSLNLPVIYVCQPYGGMDPQQMEGFITTYFELHFMYITGIHHVESKNIQGMALMKLHFHPGTNMVQAMSETNNYVARALAYMPPGTLTPFIVRFDTGSVPVGRLVFSSETKNVAQIQDLALFRVRPIFASLPGVSATPPFGGSHRTIIVTVNPERLQAYRMSPEEVVTAIAKNNRITPSGNLAVGDKFPIVSVNSIVTEMKQLESVPIRMGAKETIYVRNVGTVTDFMDAPTGYSLVNGRRAVYILATKRADASTLSVINEIKRALPRMREALGEDAKEIDVSFEFDQTKYVTQGVNGVLHEGLLGAILVGVMILLFLRDWRSALVVLLNIPLAIMVAVVCLWMFGQTINLMTLGGLALAIGILVDMSTVAVENIHVHIKQGKSIPWAVRDGSIETVGPRFLAMVCVLAVFLCAFFMQGAARGLFVPMSLSVGFAMIASYILSSTFVPVMSVWLLKHKHDPAHIPGISEIPGMSRGGQTVPLFDRFKAWYAAVAATLVRWRWLLIGGYLAGSIAVIALLGPRLGTDIFPQVEAETFQLRMRAEDGTNIGKTEQIAKAVMELVADEIGQDNVKVSLAYVGTIPPNYPINAMYHWTQGPQEATLWIDLKHGTGLKPREVQNRLREKLAEKFPGVRFSFEPADIINQVMSFGSPTPVEVSVRGPDLKQNVAFAEKVRQKLAGIDSLRDVQFGQSLEFPQIRVEIDREKAGLAGVTPFDVASAIVPATSSSRYMTRMFWADPKSGTGYQVQVEVPRRVIRASHKDVPNISTAEDLRTIPVKPSKSGKRAVRVRDVAVVHDNETTPGQIDRYNMQREVTITANIAGADLGTVAARIDAALKEVGDPPPGVTVDVRGQIPPMNTVLSGLGTGLLISVGIIFLLLAANFQSFKLAFVTVSTVPAVISGIVIALFVTGTTLNIQSFIGSIMAIGIAMANAILLVTFAENRRRHGDAAAHAAVAGAEDRLRAVLMTSAAMIAGMIPMALGFGEGGQQNAPLARAVVGGLLLATTATLLILPAVFALVQRKGKTASASMDPADPASLHHPVGEHVPSNGRQTDGLPAAARGIAEPVSAKPGH